MLNIKVDLDVELPGGAMTQLRKIAEMINRGEKKGPGWSLGEGQQDVDRELIPDDKKVLTHQLTNELRDMVLADEISDDELRHAAGDLLPALYEHLRECGFGEDPEDVKNGPESDEKDGDVGTVEKDENAKPGQPQQATQDAGAVVGEATVASNQKKDSKPWFLGKKS